MYSRLFDNEGENPVYRAELTVLSISCWLNHKHHQHQW
ncbi:hypothetical protein VCHE09_1681 [Vibrio paracholerae HE-09]|nr:hypothetical protein VCHE09_1681 [Vibrio paracholerae HE-09]